MPIKRYTAIRAVLVAALGLLTGCYQTNVRLFDQGVDAALTLGQYKCTNPNAGGAFAISLVKLSAGPQDILYAIQYDDLLKGFSAATRFGKLSSGQHLFQSEGLVQGAIDYLFVSIDNPTSFTILVPRPNPQRAQDFGLGFKPTSRGPGIVELTGSQEAVREFSDPSSPKILNSFLSVAITPLSSAASDRAAGAFPAPSPHPTTSPRPSACR
jgi:hypothetical protein